MYPYAQESDIEHLVLEMLDVGIIQPSQSAHPSQVVMVSRKYHAWYNVSKL